MCSQNTHLPEKETSTAKSRVRLPRIKHHITPFANIYCIVIYPYLSHLSLIILHSSYHICLLRTGGGPALALKEILCHSQVVGTSGFHPHYQWSVATMDRRELRPGRFLMKVCHTLKTLYWIWLNLRKDLAQEERWKSHHLSRTRGTCAKKCYDCSMSQQKGVNIWWAPS